MERSEYIGGSDAAALMGDNKYKTVRSVWERLRGKKDGDIDSQHIQRGNELEPLIEEWIRENRDPTLNNGEMYSLYDADDNSDQIFLRHPEERRLGGHPDGIAASSPATKGHTIWEIKAPASYSVENIRRYGLPARYKWQVQWYMHLAHKVHPVEQAVVCVWDCDEWNNPILISVPRNPEKGEELERRAKDLLFAAEMDTKPAAETYGDQEVGVVTGEDVDQLLGAYRETKEVEKRLKEERKRLKAKILSRADGVNTLQTENNLARIKYNHGQYDATWLKVTER